MWFNEITTQHTVHNIGQKSHQENRKTSDMEESTAIETGERLEEQQS